MSLPSLPASVTRSRRLLAAALFVSAPACTSANASAEAAEQGGSSSAADGGPQRTQANAAPAPSSTLPAGVAHVRMTGCSAHDYFATVSIGNDTFSLLLDSGSTMMAVAASSCPNCGDAERYHTAHGQSTGVQASSSYADGSRWSGTIYADQVTMGAPNAHATTPVPMNFAAITGSTDFFTGGACQKAGDVQFDGILGLGPDSLLRKNATSLLTALAQGGTLADDVFALRTCNVGGDIWFGGYDPGVTTQAPRYTAMVSDGDAGDYYGMAVDGLQLGGVALPLAASDIGPMVVDNGTSGLMLSEAAYDAVVAALSRNKTFLQHFPAELFTAGRCPASARGYTPAQLDSVLPKLSFVLPQDGGGSFAVELTATGSYLQPLLADDGGLYYCPQISPAPEGVPPLYGNAAMRQHLVVFDRSHGRVGFASHHGCSDALPAASPTN